MSDELSRTVASEKVLALCKAAAKVRGGAWIEGAPTHVLAEMLLALERDGWTLSRAPVPVERPDEDDDAAIIEWFVRMQREAEASYVIEAAAEAIANADGWDWHDDDYESPDPSWKPTDKAEYRETARKALVAARRTAAARLPEQPDEADGRGAPMDDGRTVMDPRIGEDYLACFPHGCDDVPSMAFAAGWMAAARRFAIRPDPSPSLPELEIDDGFGI